MVEFHGDLFSRHAVPLEGYVFVVVDDRGEDVLSNEICRRCNRKQQRRRRGGRTVQPPDWFVHDSDIYARTYTYVLCTRPNTLGEKQKRKTPLRSGLGKDMLNMCVKVQGQSVKNGVDIWTFVRKTRHPLLLLFMGVTVRRNAW